MQSITCSSRKIFTCFQLRNPLRGTQVIRPLTQRRRRPPKLKTPPNGTVTLANDLEYRKGIVLEQMSAAGTASESAVRVAVEGCGHGTLHSIYASVEESCKKKGWDGVDVLIIGGDFQAVRNASDLACVAMPAKYRHMGDFHEYYSGARKAPYLTIFVGGNHEASNYLWELFYGGWVAPNIYYLGAANVLRLGSLRIAGQSGIWKGYNYRKHHFERLPYGQDDIRSIYHAREIDTRKLLQIRTQVDVGLSHDWPRGVEWQGDWRTLFRKKQHLESDAREQSLGSVAGKLVLGRLRPAYWFSAHLHVKHAALIKHPPAPAAKSADDEKQNTIPSTNGAAESASAELNGGDTVKQKNDDEIDLEEDVIDATVDTADASGSDVVQRKNDDEIDLDMDDIDDTAAEARLPEDKIQPANVGQPSQEAANTNGDDARAAEEVPEDIRALLPASFAQSERVRQQEKYDAAAKKVPTIPPADIPNLTTQFLALDKCLPRRDFLQLLEIEPISSPAGIPADPTTSATLTQRPLRLMYDPEWLAITRVFERDLHVGGENDGNITQSLLPPAKHESEYRALIEAEEAWVQDHIVTSEDPAKSLVVPDNFVVTAPCFDASKGLEPARQQPREYANPQTQTFCDLLGIENKFNSTEQEALERMKIVPKERERNGADREGGGRGGGRGGWRGRGRRGGGGGGRGRGRGGQRW